VTQQPTLGDGIARFAVGLIGGAIGSYAGALVAWKLATGGCDWECGTTTTVLNVGFVAGFMTGSAVLGALPEFNSRCGTARRLGTSVMSSIAGFAIGGIVGAPVSSGTGLWLGSGVSLLAATIATHRCRSPTP
jgi:hypothetical protein